MFRIKTDIRQFNCETSEKVEKLIRSWVIRPTDLMLDESQQTWLPIGEHDDFAPLFQELKEGSDVDLVKPVEKKKPAAAQILSGHGKLKLRALDKEEESEPLPIPVAPKGVEQVVANDEPTIMTERTADLLGVLDEIPEEESGEEESEPLPIPVAPKGVEGVASNAEEATQIFERDEDEEDYELEEVSSPKEEEASEPRLGRHDLPEELFLTNEISRSDLISPLDPVMDDLANVSEGEEADTEAWVGAHESEQSDASSDSVGDIHSEWENMMELDELRDTGEFNAEEHLAAISAAEEAAVEEDIRETIELDSPVSLALQEASAADPEEDAAGESDKIIVDFSEEEDAARALALDDTEDFESDEIFSSPTAAPPSLEASAEEDEEKEHADARSAEAQGAEDQSAEVQGAEDQSAEDTEEAQDEESAVEHDAIDDVEEATDILTEEQVEQALFNEPDFVSEGYAMALPFEIAPSDEDLGYGVMRSTVSDDEKNAVFPRPEPKKLGELTSRRFGYGDGVRVSSPGSSTPRSAALSTPPKDYSRIVAIIAVVLIVLVIASLIIIFN